MIARKIGSKVFVVVPRGEVNSLRSAGVRGLPKNTDMTFEFTNQGTLLSVDPPGCDGQGFELLLKRTRNRVREMTDARRSEAGHR